MIHDVGLSTIFEPYRPMVSLCKWSWSKCSLVSWPFGMCLAGHGRFVHFCWCHDVPYKSHSESVLQVHEFLYLFYTYNSIQIDTNRMYLEFIWMSLWCFGLPWLCNIAWIDRHQPHRNARDAQGTRRRWRTAEEAGGGALKWRNERDEVIIQVQ